jgi:hypothetical protein
MKAKRKQGEKAILIAAILLALLTFYAQAELITIGFSGLIDSVGDPYNLLEGGVQEYDLISGFYVYDSETPDSDPQSHFGLYKYTSAPYGISLTVSGITFQTDADNVDFTIGITDGIPSGGGGDSYTIGSGNNLLFKNDICIETLGWRLTDYSYTAISSTELPNSPPDLTAWQSGNNLQVSGGRGGTSPCFDEIFQINGHVTDVWLVPEPATLLLFGLGGLLLRKRR